MQAKKESEIIEEALAAEEARIVALRLKLKEAKEAELNQKRDNLYKKVEQLEKDLSTEQAELKNVQAKSFDLNLQLKNTEAQEEKEGGELARAQSELHQATLDDQRRTIDALATKTKDIDGYILERRLLQEAIEEERKRRMDLDRDEIAHLLEQAPHLSAGGSAATTAEAERFRRDMPANSTRDVFALAEQVEIRRQREHQSRNEAFTQDRRRIAQERRDNLQKQKETRRKRHAIEKVSKGPRPRASDTDAGEDTIDALTRVVSRALGRDGLNADEIQDKIQLPSDLAKFAADGSDPAQPDTARTDVSEIEFDTAVDEILNSLPDLQEEAASTLERMQQHMAALQV